MYPGTHRGTLRSFLGSLFFNSNVLEFVVVTEFYDYRFGLFFPLGGEEYLKRELMTLSEGCLGSGNDEERSEMRYVMRIARPRESLRF